MKFIKKPYLPESNTVVIIADKKSEKYLEGINFIPSYECKFITKQVNTHPDMTFCHMGDKIAVVEKESYTYYKNKIEKYGFKIICGSNALSEAYPNDIAFNCVILNGMLFHKINYTDKQILEEAKKMNLKLINVRQGYTKCSTLIINETSVITGDPGLYKTYTENGIDCLLISNSGIKLEGFENGFIGGSGGLLSSDKLAFFGNIKLHPQYNEIKAFCDRRGVKIIILGDGEVTDFGSLIPIVEEKS